MIRQPFTGGTSGGSSGVNIGDPTDVSGLLKGADGKIARAVPSTDYISPSNGFKTYSSSVELTSFTKTTTSSAKWQNYVCESTAIKSLCRTCPLFLVSALIGSGTALGVGCGSTMCVINSDLGAVGAAALRFVWDGTFSSSTNAFAISLGATAVISTEGAFELMLDGALSNQSDMPVIPAENIKVVLRAIQANVF